MNNIQFFLTLCDIPNQTEIASERLSFPELLPTVGVQNSLTTTQTNKWPDIYKSFDGPELVLSSSLLIFVIRFLNAWMETSTT
ncbi:hypothetical protein T02_11385 [Trichinella nativa]|uniref:Uncharacterized protein n=1 Tax=Trichinella nativa TaxID=6335 RepID=A0A0V1KJC0_9BILA|nr:hypothetical protein T02_11385 [Trichinella nativa]